MQKAVSFLTLLLLNVRIGLSRLLWFMSAMLLPTALTYQPQHNNFVYQHPRLAFASQQCLGVMAKRILALVLDQITPADRCLRAYYQVTVASIAASTGQNLHNAYAEIKGAIRELAVVTWQVQRLDGKIWEVRHLLDTTCAKAIGYCAGVVTLILNPQLAEYFLPAVDCPGFYLNYYLSLKSWYAMRLYELLAACRQVGVWQVSIEEYRRLVNCQLTESHELQSTGRVRRSRGKYAQVADLLLYTVTRPLTELADTDLSFTCMPLQAPPSGKGRPAIQELRFEMRA